MIKYGGQHSMKINVVNKPIKGINNNNYLELEGFRAFALCESSSGYVLR